ncbi:MAG: zinc-dependent peptidase [Sedimentisphaerales bacterium]|nr:zinc-dependent peptidase [Sedimentisphaerales bacterium]
MLFRKTRRRRIANRPFPAEWLAIVERNVPLFVRLPAADRDELKRHILIFMAEKKFEGCGGLRMTDEIKVTIAAHACLLLLHRRTQYYPSLKSILVYPRAFVVTSPHLLGGTVLEGRDVRLGESWHRGSVVLSWDDVRRTAADINDGQNVVLHEFAHQLDSSGGKGDSTPVLESRSSFLAWARALGEDFEKFRRDIRANRAEVLDEYGAVDPAEFFAVATECFFEQPAELRQVYPRLYDELRRFYQQDPAASDETGHSERYEPGR